MKIGRTAIKPVLRVRRPHPTVRWRLALLYTVLFLICGAALLAITNDLFANFAFSGIKPSLDPGSGRLPTPGAVKIATALSVQRSIGLNRLRIESAIALGIMTAVSGVLGWLVAGRVLAPLRTITATAERISDTNLNERLAMPGPRDELRVLADTIDRLLARLEAAFDAQRRFVANASHELRTPLAVMRTTLDVAIAKPGEVPAQTRELDADLRVDLDHADQLLESFLSLARAQSGRLGQRDRVALEPIIAVALGARSEAIAAKHLTVETHLAAVEVAGSATLLGRMIENVVENAVRHNRPGGSIVIRVEPFHAQVRVLVDSGGPKLDEAAVAQLAEPFKRLNEDRTGSQNGHGLGLSIVAAVVAAHDGDLHLHARATGGLRVEIILPAAVAQLARGLA